MANHAEHQQIHYQYKNDKYRGGAAGARHAAAVVDPVERHREQVAEDQIDLAAEPVSPVGTALGPTVENAHEHREAHMTRHRQDRRGSATDRP